MIVQVQTIDQAREAVDAGVDAIVAQGTEAGGHGGARATLPFVPAVIDIAQGVPVIAAGGIADGRGLAAALALGASGVLCGTTFFVSDESLASENTKQAALNGSGDDICLIQIAFGLSNCRHSSFDNQWCFVRISVVSL